MLWEVLDAATLVPALLVTAVAGLMRGYSGFGSAIVLAPVYATLWGPQAGVPVVLMMDLFSSLVLVPRALATADRRVVLPMGVAAMVATPVGAAVLIAATGPDAADLLRRTIGALVLGFGLLLFGRWRYHGRRPAPLNLAVGALAGLMKGATGMSGPPVILYFLSGPEAVRQHRANLILFFGLIGVVAVFPPLFAGLIDGPALLRTALMVPALLGCVPLGARLFGVVPERLYRPFALVLLLLSGGVALLS